MRTATLVPAAVLIAGIAAVITIERIVQTRAPSTNEPRLNLTDMHAIASGPGSTSNFAAHTASVAAGKAVAEQANGILTLAGNTFNFSSEHLDISEAGLIVLSGDVVLSNAEHSFTSATIVLEPTGSMQGQPIDLSYPHGNASADEFVLGADGKLKLVGNVRSRISR